MARNQRTQTKTTVTPNIRPVDTFVQAAPLDTTRIRELDAFISNLTPRISRYAQIAQGRQDKKDVTAAQKAYATVADKLLEYDEQVKAGAIPPDQSPMFRFAFNQSQGSQLGLNFIQGANEAYMKSKLPSATSSAGFNKWFDGYKADYMENNKGLLDLIGSFDAFDGYARQAQQNLLTSHLAKVRKNFTTSASDNAILQANKAVEASEALIENQIRLSELSDPLMQKELGHGLAKAAAQEITKATNDIVQSSSNYIKYPKQNKKVIDAVVGRYVEIADANMEDDDRTHIDRLGVVLGNIKTRDGMSLLDTAYGEWKFREAKNKIRDNFIERSQQQDTLLRTARENTETQLINEVYKTISEYPLLDNESLLLALQTNPDLMNDIEEFGLGNWTRTALEEFGSWKENAKEPMTDWEKATQTTQLITNKYHEDPLESLKIQQQMAKDNILTKALRGNLALEILNKIDTRIRSLEKERADLGRIEADKRASFYKDPSFNNITKMFEAEDKSFLGKLARDLGEDANVLWENYGKFKILFSTIYHDVDGNGERTWFKKTEGEREKEVQDLFSKEVADLVAVKKAEDKNSTLTNGSDTWSINQSVD